MGEALDFVPLQQIADPQFASRFDERDLEAAVRVAANATEDETHVGAFAISGDARPKTAPT